ncbi:hypothetical protein [Olivibacter sitiensis]|uniref:hypothetical protein n=1 Tax=Olivibacter sitiensis TaxID=376470 RepID=UPI00041595C9|nr:hypothetical protein [Olivibacter sitiensis]
MVVLVYSGSRFADWRLVDKGNVLAAFKTLGINPNHSDERYITQLLNKSNILVNHAEKIKKIHFFGAGSSDAEGIAMIKQAFASFFRYAKITVNNDLLAAAFASLGEQKGIVCVLGSGTNAAYFSGRRLEANNFGLGYILGDEGSSNWMGRYLLRSLLTDVMPMDIKTKFIAQYPLDKKQILDRVYRINNPALFLSSFTDFVMENKEEPFIKNMILEGLHLVFDTYLLPLSMKHPGIPISFTGSIASRYEDWVRDIADKHKLAVERVIKEPIHNLLNYYINKN